MTGSVVISSAIRTNLLQAQRDSENLGNAIAKKTLNSPATQAKTKEVEDSFAASVLDAQAGELSQSLETINQGLRILENTDNALSKLSGLLRQSSNLADTVLQDIKTDAVKTPEKLGAFEIDFNKNTQAISEFVNQFSEKGVNLLQGDEISITLNQEAAPVIVEGRNYDSQTLGLSGQGIKTGEDLNAIKNNLRQALDSVQNYSVVLRESISTFQTRQGFTSQSIDALKEGAKGFEVKDLSEEGINLLALQTRQQLSASNVSLATPAQNSILRLF